MKICQDPNRDFYLKFFADANVFTDKFTETCFLNARNKKLKRKVIKFDYSMEPFDSFPNNIEFLEQFKKECYKIFRDIGKKHIANIFYIIKSCTTYGIPYRIPRHDKKDNYKQAQELLEFIKLREYFLNQTTFEELTKIVDYHTLQYFISALGFNRKRHTEPQLKELKLSIFNNQAVPVEVEEGKDLLIHFHGKVALTFGDKHFPVDNIGCYLHVVKYHIQHLLKGQRISETPFYEALLLNTEDPDIKKLETALNDMKVTVKEEEYWNEGTKALILEISKYLNDNTKLTLTKSRGKALSNVRPALPKDMKFFLFDLLLLIGLINDHNSYGHTGYSLWKDYETRKQSYRSSTTTDYKNQVIEKIMRSKLKPIPDPIY